MRKAGFDEMRRIIREDEPPRPSGRISTLNAEVLSTVSGKRRIEPRKLGASFRGELDWIVMRAMDKDRNRRYQSASDFVSDIERYLNDEPVEACPPSAAYRLKKFTRRNKAALMTAVVVISALFVGTAVSVWQTIEANDARDLASQRLEDEQAAHRKANDAQRAEKKERERAEKNFQNALDAVDQMLSEVGEKDLADVPGTEHVRRKLLQKALRFYEGFLRQKGDSPSIREELGWAHLRIGSIHGQLGDQELSEKFRRDAISIFDALVTEFPGHADYLLGLASSKIRLGDLLENVNRRKGAETEYKQSITILKKLVKSQAVTTKQREVLGGAHNNLGGLFGASSRLNEATKEFRNSEAIWRQLLTKSPDSSVYQHPLASALNNLGKLAYSSTRIEKAEPLFVESLKIEMRVLKDDPENPEHRAFVAEIRSDLAMMLVSMRRYKEGEEALTAAIQDRRQLVKQSPYVPQYRFELSQSVNRLAKLCHYTKRLQESDVFFTEAAALLEKLSTEFPKRPLYRYRLAGTYNNWALMLQAAKRKTDAIKQLRAALAIQRKLAEEFPKDPVFSRGLGGTLVNLGLFLRPTAEFAESREQQDAAAQSRKLLDEAVEQLLATVNRNPEDVTSRLFLRNAYGELAKTCQHQRDHRATAKAAWSYSQVVPGSTGIRLNAFHMFSNCVSLVNLEKGTSETKRRERVETYPELARKLVRQLSVDPPTKPSDCNDIAVVLATFETPPFRDPTRAVEFAKMAIKQEPDNLGFQGTLGIAHYRAGNWQEAVVVLEPVVRLSKGRALFKRFFLAMAHWQLGDKAEARKSFDRAVKIVVDQKVKYNRKLHIVGGEARELLGIPAAPP